LQVAASPAVWPCILSSAQQIGAAAQRKKRKKGAAAGCLDCGRGRHGYRLQNTKNTAGVDGSR